MIDFIIVAILAIVIGAAVIYIMKAKKSGVKCIGCPAAGECAHKRKEASACSCGCSEINGNDDGCHADIKE